ncbi:MAG: DegV family protein [Lachnospiraceae bacterium]|nr:DegV family protein [Lachnospiraceae bacterium]
MSNTVKTAVMTDTNSSIFEEEAKELGVFAIPMPILIDGRVYYEGISISNEEFLKALREKRDVSTSQPSPADVMEAWDRVLSSDYDEIVYIPMTSGLSSSYAMAAGCAADYDGKVAVVDNRRISIAQKTTVLDARNMADRGMRADQIRGVLEAQALDYIIYLAVDTLEYFMKSGRAASSAASLVTNVLNVKPILKTNGNTFEPVTVARGEKKCAEKMLDAIRLNLSTRFKDTEPSELLIGAATSCVERKDAEHWFSLVQEAFPDHPTAYVPLSCNITVHTGPNARGMAVIRRIKKSAGK